MKTLVLAFVVALFGTAYAACLNPTTAPPPTPPITSVVMVLFENANQADAMAQPYFGARHGIYFNNYFAITHPSQPNYLALVGGDTFGVTDDNNHDINATHLGDLLEAKGLNWKVYAENYPGNCFTGAQSGNYVRKHNPFMSFLNVSTNTTRCNAHIVPGTQFFTDLHNNQLPAFALYIPNLQNDGHDTSVSFADSWASSTLAPAFNANNAAFWQPPNNPLVVYVFDEDADAVPDPTNNQVYLMVAGQTTTNIPQTVLYNHYSLLNLVEAIFSLPSLGRNDATATQMNNVFQ